jgi:hypothetical protein
MIHMPGDTDKAVVVKNAERSMRLARVVVSLLADLLVQDDSVVTTKGSGGFHELP